MDFVHFVSSILLRPLPLVGGSSSETFIKMNFVHFVSSILLRPLPLVGGSSSETFIKNELRSFCFLLYILFAQFIISCFDMPFKTLPSVIIASGCLLYTSDAADDLLCADLGGPRIIKKKKEVSLSILLRINHKKTK